MMWDSGRIAAQQAKKDASCGRVKKSRKLMKRKNFLGSNSIIPVRQKKILRNNKKKVAANRK